ncbi:hypothetical protein JCM10908_006781 [Rhodotorula pacifica]|uniref:uncharacterized protein n=1 Tax=Rhodotorula pacifica TaxID=1495444 RepID=UPI0031798AFC
MVSTRSQRIPLSSLSALTLHSNRRTASRRLPPVPQLACKGSLCRKYTPDVVQCVAVGSDGVGGLEWKCEADLPSGFRFGEVAVSCEGWDGPDDPNILRGSCGLTYSLVRASSSLEDGYSSYKSYLPGRSSSIFNSTFNLLFTALTVYLVGSLLVRLLRSLYNRFFAGRRGSTPANRPPRTWGGWGGGGGGGGGGNGGSGPRPPPSSGPPPPYTPKPDPACASGNETGWRPGFWSGAALGWIANAFLGTGRAQQVPPRAHPVYEEYDVFGRPTGLGPRFGGGGGGGFWGGGGGLRGAPAQGAGWGWGGRQAGTGGSGFGMRRRDDDDRGVGTSASGGMRRSTGFGGTNVR